MKTILLAAALFAVALQFPARAAEGSVGNIPVRARTALGPGCSGN